MVVGGFDSIAGSGIRALLEDSPEVRLLATAPGATELMQIVADCAPDVVILDETVEQSLLETIRQTCGRPPRLVVLAHAPSLLFATMLAAAGAVCVAAAASDREVLTAILSPAEDGDAGGAPRPADLDAVGSLTRREAMVLEHLRRGCSYVEIGHALGISPETARTHTRRICMKIGVSNKRKLIGYSLAVDSTNYTR